MQDRFKWSILALAQSASVQIGLFPDFVCVGDELALNFENGLLEVDSSNFTENQRTAVSELDQLLLSLSGDDGTGFWFDKSALNSDSRWNDLRASARKAAEAFDWPIVPPSPSDDIYIGAEKTV